MSIFSNAKPKEVSRADDCREIEITLKRQIEETRALLGSIGDGVVATDEKGRVIFLNRAATEMTQWKMEDAAGKSWNESVAAEDERGVPVPLEKRTITQALKSGQLIRTKYCYARKDGSKFSASSTANPVMIDGGISGVILTFRDITKEREIDRAKTEFVSLASHQLRTPLATVNWYTEILLSGDVVKPAPEQEKYLKEIYAANQRMTELINALLNVSRIELGAFVYNRELIDFNQIIDGIVSDLALKIQAKKINFDKKIDSSLREIVSDARNLEIILANLLSNAVKYTPSGGQIKLVAAKDGDDLVFSVADNGYGITVGQQARVFEKFFRADNVREKDTEGTGLGLYIVKALVSRMGGQISFESVENKGTTFHVSIPLGVAGFAKD